MPLGLPHQGLDVARRWGLSVETFDGERGRRPRPLSPWQRDRPRRQEPLDLVPRTSALRRSPPWVADRKGSALALEIVAELGGAVLLCLLGLEQEADLGGCREYVQRYADEVGIEMMDACGRVLDRTCQAGALLLDAAEKIGGMTQEPGAGESASVVGH